jgi:AraC family transcriptional regulator
MDLNATKPELAESSSKAMSEESALQTMASSSSVRAEEFRTLRAASDESSSLLSVAAARERVQHLVRHAMTILESDRQAASRCLNLASTLLGSESQASGTAAAATEYAFRPGGLARWQGRRVLAYIEANLGSKIDIRELADLVALSNSHFSRAFTRSFGLPPMAYVATRRVERAKLMMTSTRQLLAAIAMACGFADQSHLNRSFRRRVGVSPGIWRRTQVLVRNSPGLLSRALSV